MSTIADEFLALVGKVAARRPVPRVNRLILPPPDVQGKEAEFCALELDDGSVGCSFTLLGDTLPGLYSGNFDLSGADTQAVASWYAEKEPARRAIGLAAINAVTQFFFRCSGYVPATASDSVGQLNARPADHVGMIGLFRPLLEPVLASGARLTIAELKPELAGDKEGFRVTLDLSDLSSCNKVVSTSTVLLNDTLERVLANCAGAEYFAIIGPTAGCFPDPLFRRGVALLGGVAIMRTAEFAYALSHGAGWGRFARKTAIHREAYPGFDELLSRIR